MPLTSTGPVRAHVANLRQAGMGTRRIAAAARVGRSTVQAAVRFPTMTSTTAAAILAVRPLVRPPANWTDATGSQRRIQALTALGWSMYEQATLGGQHATPYRRILGQRFVLIDTPEAVKRVYDKLSMTVADARSASWVRALARRRCYFPPLAWDDETIDDPQALPCLLPPAGPVDRDLELAVQHVAAGHPVEAGDDVVREVVRRTMSWRPREVRALLGGHDEQVANLRKRVGRSC